MVEKGELSAGHARTLLSLPRSMQEEAAKSIKKNDLSVRQTELLCKKLQQQKKDKKSAKPALTVDYAEEAGRELTARLGRPVKIVSGRKKGRIELEYYGVDDLNTLIDALYTMKK